MPTHTTREQMCCINTRLHLVTVRGCGKRISSARAKRIAQMEGQTLRSTFKREGYSGVAYRFSPENNCSE